MSHQQAASELAPSPLCFHLVLTDLQYPSAEGSNSEIIVKSENKWIYLNGSTTNLMEHKKTGIKQLATEPEKTASFLRMQESQ